MPPSTPNKFTIRSSPSTPNIFTIRSSREWSESPTPKALDVMYRNIRKQHDEFKDEVQEFMRRLVADVGCDVVNNVVLDTEPLVKVYDFFLQAAKELEVSLVVISDSSSSQL